MASPISPMEALELVKKAVALYKQIHDYPHEIAEVGKRMQHLEFYLSSLSKLLDKTNQHSLATLRPELTHHLIKIIRDIRVDAADVYEILKIWASAGTVARVLFAVGKNPRKLEDLRESIAIRTGDLRDILQVLGLFALQPLQPPPKSPSPVSSPAVQNSSSSCAVLFVDPNNLGRSKVAEGYVKLVREWTVRTGGSWPIKFAHSAGIRVRDRCDCVDVLQGLAKPIPMRSGNKAPFATAAESLFDNKFFDYPYKAAVREKLLSRSLRHPGKSRSRGITRDLFKTYDYILVFVGREYESLLALKKALVTAGGEDAAPQGKGRILHLGAYLKRDGKPVEIVDAPKKEDGTSNRAEWNATTSQIKLAVKTFLKTELYWEQPPKGALQG